MICKKNKKLNFKPTGDLSDSECYVDADFAENYAKETCEDPDSVKSRT